MSEKYKLKFRLPWLRGMLLLAMIGSLGVPGKRADGAEPSELVNSWLRDQSETFKAWDIGGQLRVRYEHATFLDAPGASGVDTKHGPVDFRASGGDASNDHLLLRELIHIGYTPAPWVSFYVEGRDSSSTGDDRDPNPDADQLDLHQAYVCLGDAKRFLITLKMGRQELSYGDERLIGAADWTNVKRTFDAIKLRYENGGSWVDAFAARPVITWDDCGNESNDYDLLAGIYASTTRWIPVQESQIYFLARMTERPSPFFYGLPPAAPLGATPREIYTMGARVKSLPGELGGWDYTAEAAFQVGRFGETTPGAPPSVANHSLDQQAYAAVISGGYTWTNVAGTPRLGVEYVYSSGDSNPTDGTHETFDNLFPTNHRQFGVLDLFSWQNVEMLHFSATVKPQKSLTLAADYRLCWLADTHDSFYTSKGARRGGLASTGGLGFGVNPSFSSFVGSEIDLVATYTFKPNTILQGGLGHFFAGDYITSSLSALGGATDADFIYAQFTFNF